MVKRDVMKASVMLEHEEKYTVILAFDVKVERDAQEMADNVGVKIFQVGLKKLLRNVLEINVLTLNCRPTSSTTCSTASPSTRRS